eukprot:scaffold283799_cov15-Tisochrysis_lutea.AAC.1
MATAKPSPDLFDETVIFRDPITKVDGLKNYTDIIGLFLVSCHKDHNGSGDSCNHYQFPWSQQDLLLKPSRMLLAISFLFAHKCIDEVLGEGRYVA